MAEREQIRPLTPAASAERPESSNGGDGDDDETAMETIINKKDFRRKRCIKCCVAILAFHLIEATVILILIFTVFKVKDPIIKLNAFEINRLLRLDLVNVSSSNVTLTADVSVKNRNYASFKYRNTTTIISYHGTVIGEARSPAGKAKARRTMRMNVTLDVMSDRLIGHPMLSVEMGSGLITMTSYTKVGGKVKMIKIISKHVTVKLKCSISVNTTTRVIQEQKCKTKVKL